MFESICVFLNGTNWIMDSLTTLVNSTKQTKCISPHLTSFAVFVTPRRLGGSDDLQRVASIVSYIVVSISFLALLLSLILFIYVYRKKFLQSRSEYCILQLLFVTDISFWDVPFLNRDSDIQWNFMQSYCVSSPLYLADCVCVDTLQWNSDSLQTDVG